jgi:selenocysteine-specific elongation factor
VAARTIVLEADEIPAGSSGWVQLYSESPLAAAVGDHFVLRLPSPSLTLGGGRFADVSPRRHARHDSGVGASLQRRVEGGALQEELAKYPRGVLAEKLLKASLSEHADVEGLEARRAGAWLFSPAAWNGVAERARRELAAYHAAHPLRAGMARGELQSRLGLAPPAFNPVLAGLVEEDVLVERQGEVALPDHRVELEPASGPAARLLGILGREPFAPPSLAEAMRESGAGTELVKALAQRGELVRLSEEVAFTRAAYESAQALVRETVAQEGSVTVARLRDRMGASRRPVLALLEYLDAQRITRRVGDDRVLRS